MLQNHITYKLKVTMPQSSKSSSGCLWKVGIKGAVVQ